jgi:hypothetical protein
MDQSKVLPIVKEETGRYILKQVEKRPHYIDDIIEEVRLTNRHIYDFIMYMVRGSDVDPDKVKYAGLLTYRILEEESEFGIMPEVSDEIYDNTIRFGFEKAYLLKAKEQIEHDNPQLIRTLKKYVTDHKIYDKYGITASVLVYKMLELQAMADRKKEERTINDYTLPELQEALKRAIKIENYEDAAKIRDKIKEKITGTPAKQS